MQPSKHTELKSFLRECKSNRKNTEIIFLLQNLDSAINVGHMFRIADAVGATELVLTGRTPKPGENDDITITSMSNEQRIDWVHFEKYEDGIDYVKKKGMQLVSLEITPKSEDYRNVEYDDKVCILLGNETAGVYPYSLSRSDKVVHLPMYGKNYSLNVHVASAILAYHILNS